MTGQLAKATQNQLIALNMPGLPEILVNAGPENLQRFIEYFFASIRNPQTRRAYAGNVVRFLDWCQFNGIDALKAIRPTHVATYVECLLSGKGLVPQPAITFDKNGRKKKPRKEGPLAVPSVKQHLTAIKECFDYLVTAPFEPRAVTANPATSVKSPAYSVSKGKTQILTPEEVYQFFEAIPNDTIIGMRNRAIVSILFYHFGRIESVLSLPTNKIISR